MHTYTSLKTSLLVRSDLIRTSCRLRAVLYADPFVLQVPAPRVELLAQTILIQGLGLLSQVEPRRWWRLVSFP
jgi:hypothetical protein